MEYNHVPVMLKEAIETLDVKPGGIYVDCTFGGGGYTFEIAKRIGVEGLVIGIDMDDLALENAKCKMQNAKLRNILLIKDNFGNLRDIFERNEDIKDKKIDGIVFDLGLSSAQIEDDCRGISFQKDRPLRMEFGDRYEEYGGTSTEEIVNKWGVRDLEKIIRDYGEEKYYRKIAAAIVKERLSGPIKSTFQLVEIIKKAVPVKYQHERLHFATRTFQALRIATNNELEVLEEALKQALEILRPGGRMVVISYHSLEDRIVKKFIREESQTCHCTPQNMVCNCEDVARLKNITKKIVLPSEGEVRLNPRARSAKLRAAEKLR